MKKERKNIDLKSWWWLPVLFLLLVINYAGSVFHGRIDLTNERRFTLSQPVKKLLKNYNGEISVDVFLKGEFPSGFKRLAGSAEDLLREFREVAGNKFQYHFVSPEEEMPGTGKSYADTLAGMGAQAINLKSQLKAGEQSQFVYPVALVHYGNNMMPVNLYAGTKMVITPADLNTSEAQMEYKFANAIEKLMNPTKPLVAYSAGNGEDRSPRITDLVDNIIGPDYQFGFLDISAVPVISDTFKLLIILKPKIPFTEAEKMRIDQYIMRGGKVLWMLDRLEAETDSLQIKQQVVAYDRNLNLEDMLFKYGVRINPDLLMDLQSDFLPLGVNGGEQFEFQHWNYYPLFESRSNHLINKNLGLVAGRFVNTIDTVKAEGIQKTILLASSPNSRAITAPALISLNENRNAPEDAAFKDKDLAAAVLLEGKFTSLYANRMPAAMLDSFNLYGQPYQPSSINPNRMIVISDGDIAMNSMYQGQPLMMGMNFFTMGTQYEYRFANREFIQNCIEYLVNNSGLSEAKSKDYVLRVLDKKKTDEERTKWIFINILIPVLLVVIFGIVYQWLRTKKYASRKQIA